MKSWVEFRHCFKNSDLIMLEYSGQWNKTSVTGKKKKSLLMEHLPNITFVVKIQTNTVGCFKRLETVFCHE